MKFEGVGEFSMERNSGSATVPLGELGEAVVKKCEHLAAVFMSE